MANVSGSAIYSPLKEGLPHLVVAVEDGEATAFVPASSRDEARAILADQRVSRESVEPTSSLS
jgi:hypothetical protein